MTHQTASLDEGFFTHVALEREFSGVNKLMFQKIAFLREYLGLTEDVVPATHKAQKGEMRPTSFADKPARGFGKPGLDRGGYRGGETDKITEAGPGSVPVGGYRAAGGFGRGAPLPQ